MIVNMSIKTKSWIILALFLTTLLIIALISLSLLKETIIHERKAMLVHVTNIAHNIIRSHYALYQSGKLTEAEARKSAIANLRNFRTGKNSYIFVYKGGVAVLAPEHPQNEGKDLINVQDLNGVYIGREMIKITQGGKAGFLSYYWYRPGDRIPVEKLSYVRGFEPWGWYVGTGVYQDDLKGILMGLLKKKVGLLLLSFLAVIALVTFIYTINRSSVERTLKVKGYLETLGRGDFTEKIIPEGKDEIGQMTQTLSEVQAHFDGIIRELKQAANSVLTGITSISDNNGHLQERTENQSLELAEINTTLQRITAITRNNAHSTEIAAASAGASRKTVAEGEAAMLNAMAAMEKINQSSEKVNEIITVIDDLAFQTNLLALNAAVEAARAGEHGRGFAVVATEVRNLAQRSGDSAQEIRKLISESAANVKLGTDLVNSSGELLREILQNSDKISKRLAEIATESDQQSKDVEHTSQVVDELSCLSQENLMLVKSAAASSSNVSNDALFMHEKMQFFVLRESIDSTSPGKEQSGHKTPAPQKPPNEGSGGHDEQTGSTRMAVG